MSEKPKKKPVVKYRSKNVSCAVWENTAEKDGKPVTFYNVQFQRSYKDSKGKWQTTNSFTPQSLGDLAVVTRKAQEFCCLSTEENEAAT